MTEQTGGQPPAGWYPDGSGQVRYWDGSGWTEHVQPQTPEAPTPEPIAQQPVEPTPAAVPAASVPAAAAAAGGYDTTGYASADSSAPQPFYKKPAGIAVLAAVLLLVIGGAAFALTSGGDDEDTGLVANPGVVASTPASTPAPTTATSTYTLNCEPTSKIENSNTPYPFNLTLTVTPTEISVSSDASINNTGPTTIEVAAYRFDADVTVNGTPLALKGPTNPTEAKGDPDKQPIFASGLPLVAKAATPATAGATPTVVLTDLWFNNIAGGNGTEAVTDIFDSRCNASPQPNSAPAPIGLAVPPVAGGVVPSVAPSVASSVTP